MHAFLSSFTAAALFIHASFGCCWHHVHSCVLGGGMIAVAGPMECCHHGHESSPGQGSERPCDGDDECEGTCSYVLPQKVQMDAPWAVASLDLVATLSTASEAQVIATLWGNTGDSALGAVPPLRLHLLHQLMLN
jgi:hypothetical protein